MALNFDIQRTSVDKLFLDPKNPRLGKRGEATYQGENEILVEMKSFELAELAHSFMEAKRFWPQEAVIVVKENIYNSGEQLVVVEGNRRIATLKWLWKTIKEDNPPAPSWATQFPADNFDDALFTEVPYFVAENRSDVNDYIAFRHVTGVRQWAAADKAYFIAQRLEDGESYDQVRKSVGSTTPAVKANYLAYRVLLQMEEKVESFNPENAKNRFAVLYMALKSNASKSYLCLPTEMDPTNIENPVAEEKIHELTNYTKWIYGIDGGSPTVTDTRQVRDLNIALSNPEALAYLEKAAEPKLKSALKFTGSEEIQIVENLDTASSLILEVSERITTHLSSNDVQSALKTFEDARAQLENSCK